MDVLDENFERQLPLKIDFLQNVPKSQKRCARGCYIGKQSYFWKIRNISDKNRVFRTKIGFDGQKKGLIGSCHWKSMFSQKMRQEISRTEKCDFYLFWCFFWVFMAILVFLQGYPDFAQAFGLRFCRTHAKSGIQKWSRDTPTERAGGKSGNVTET
jgi:hypothetical protein